MRYINNGYQELKEAELPNGIYFLRLQHAGKTIYQGRMVVIQ
jgi:hypothetical protein